MTIAPGTRIGPYEITAPIGVGGMGEVYRATDTVLDRAVAVKVLPKAFVAEPNRVARFRHEAKILAALNHVNIAQIHGLEETDGTLAIVMELVDGPTLADCIEQGPLPPDEAMGIAMQIVDALEAAHARGIVHRDLKPANIKVRDDGTVKVLDFGIAKGFSDGDGATAGQPPITTVTQAGVVVGTAAYMSPEQTRGLPVDQRTDVWAFGCVLFEMLTGQSAFGGEDASLTLARVLAQETKLDSLPAGISPAVRQTLRVCLSKEPKDRVADIRDVRLALQGAFETVLPGAVAAGSESMWMRRVATAVALVGGAAIAGLVGWTLNEPMPQPLTRTLIAPSSIAPYVPNFVTNSVAIAPDASRIVYRGLIDGQPRIFVRNRGRLEATALSGLTANVGTIFVSPDGDQIGFADGSALYRVPIVGGPPTLITDSLDGFLRGATWGPDGTIVFASSGPKGLQRVSADGGEPEEITSPGEAGRDHLYPAYLADGSGVLFTVYREGDDLDAAQIAFVSLPDLAVSVLFSGGTSAQYAPSGHIVYAHGADLNAVQFDPDTRAVTSTPVAVESGVRVSTRGMAEYALSTNGTLVYARGGAAADGNSVVVLERGGGEEVLDLAPRGYSFPRVSPDGTRLALDVDSQDVWVYDLSRGVLNRVTMTPDMDNRPLWTPDGERLVFATLREGLGRFSFFEQRADGTGPAEKLLTSPGPGNFKPHGWSPDGALMVFDYGQPPALDIGVLDLEGEENWRPLLDSDATEAAPSLSPDGRWIAYASDRSGRCEVYVERFPELGERQQISTAGGAGALWSANGRELFYRQSTRLMSVRIDLSVGFSAAQPEVVLDGLSPAQLCNERTYDASADGRRFYVVEPLAANDADTHIEFVLVQNWLPELERLVPAR